MKQRESELQSEREEKRALNETKRVQAAGMRKGEAKRSWKRKRKRGGSTTRAVCCKPRHKHATGGRERGDSDGNDGADDE